MSRAEIVDSAQLPMTPQTHSRYVTRMIVSAAAISPERIRAATPTMTSSPLGKR
jgi:hypothetical protein